MTWAIDAVREEDLPELLPLLRGYLDVYAVHPSDADLLRLCRTLLADPDREGVQLLARGPDGAAAGFATVYWTWSTTRAGRIGMLNDLFVAEHARGRGLAEQLIEAAAERAHRRGATDLGWVTAPDNRRAQAVYDRIGAARSEWVHYDLSTAR